MIRRGGVGSEFWGGKLKREKKAAPGNGQVIFWKTKFLKMAVAGVMGENGEKGRKEDFCAEGAGNVGGGRGK